MLTPQRLLTANAIAGLVSGVALLVVPGAFLSILGLELDTAGTAFARLYGAELLGFNVATWLSRNLVPPPSAIIRGHIANEGLTALVIALIAAAGLGNPLVWGVAAVAAAFAIGYLVVNRQTS